MAFSRSSKIDTRWYLAVHCEKCQSPIFFALDYGEGVEERHSPLPERLMLTCPSETCRYRADYTAGAIFRLQKQTGTTDEPQVRKVGLELSSGARR